MGRPRGFDEQAVTRAAVALFAGRAYDGLSVDDLVNGLGVHRNSLYKTFGSKRGLYLTALRWYLEHDLEPLLAAATGDGRDALLAGGALDLLLLAAVEQAPSDAEVATLIGGALTRLDAALGPDRATELLGLRLRARVSASTTGSSTSSFIGE
jgi:TetR/AcrR family transcriptional regulator, transcriptional repressor for nem operon